jgi:hypothetical protein
MYVILWDYICKRKFTFVLYLFVPLLDYEVMSDTESVKLIEKLKTWADAERGRRSEIARMLGVPRQRLTDWISGRKSPTLEQGLRIYAFLKRTK